MTTKRKVAVKKTKDESKANSKAKDHAKKREKRATSSLVIGSPAPMVEGVATSGVDVNREYLTGKNIVLYFYPKDSTSGCTLEGQDFSRLYKKFKKLDTEIIGVSRDSLKSHENFKCKYQFPFELLSDSEEKMCKAFEVLQMKSMYGRKFLGVERSTFLIDKKGVLRQEWRKVKVQGHADEVLAEVQKLTV